jgi:hypothetical protein
MVDDRAMRFKQGYGAPAPKPAASTPNPLDALVSNYLRTSGHLADDQVKYGGATGGFGSRTADLLVEQGVPDSFPLRAGALVGDIALDPSWLIPGVGATKGVKAGARLAKDPTVQARANSLMGRLYHGNRNEPWSVAATRSYEERMPNWFSADLFSTPDLKLASSYGDDAVYSLKNLPPDLKVLDLMPGGKSVAEQSPGLAKALSNLPSMGGNNTFDDVTDMARHRSLTNLLDDQLAKTMQEYGFNALRHVSGQGVGRGVGRAKPVYAFFNPAGITANPISPVNRAMYQTNKALSDIPGTARKGAEKFAGRLTDTVDDAFRKSADTGVSPVYINPSVSDFLNSRGNVVPGSYSSTGTARRIFVDPDTGRTVEAPYRPYPAVSGFLQTLGKPGVAIRSAKAAASNAYQKALDEYPAMERANRQKFMDSYQQANNFLYGGNLPGMPMPPGYTPLPRPAKTEPKGLDFLQYLFQNQ